VRSYATSGLGDASRSASKGSKYFENEQKKARDTEAQVQRVVARLKAKIAERRGDLSGEEAQAEKLAAEMEATRRLCAVRSTISSQADALAAIRPSSSSMPMLSVRTCADLRASR
jgi:phage shock protein A